MFTPQKVMLTRDVTMDECEWLREDLAAGQQFWTHPDDYHLCSTGVMVSRHKLEKPFFEIPPDSYKEVFSGVDFSIN